MDADLTPEQIVEQIERLDPDSRRKLKSLLASREGGRDWQLREPAAAYAIAPRTAEALDRTTDSDGALIEDEEERLKKLEEEFHQVFPDIPISRELLSLVGICELPAGVDEDDDFAIVSRAISAKYLDQTGQ